MRVALGVGLGVGGLWYFLPGIFDPSSRSVLGSEHRRSPLAGIGGPRTVLNELIEAREDQYLRHEVRLDVPSTVSIKVMYESGPKVELYLLNEDGYREFSAAARNAFGGTFRHFEAFKGTISKQMSYGRAGNLPAGDYVILIENTDLGDVAPPFNMSDDVARLRVQVTID